MAVNTFDQNRLVSRAEIAALAEVKRPAVSNWARRHTDFPKPVRSGEAEYFRLTEILAWLGRATVPARLRTEGEAAGATYGDRVRRNLPSHEEDLRPATLLQDPQDLQHAEDRQRVAELMGPLADKVRGDGSVLDYLCLVLSLTFLQSNEQTRDAVRHARTGLTGTQEDSHTLLRRIGTQTDDVLRGRGVLPGMSTALTRLSPRTYADLLRAVRLTERLGPGSFRLILDEYEERADLHSAEFLTPHGVARLVARLALSGRSGAARMFDPYLRGGELLAAAAEEAGTQGENPAAVRGESVWQDTLRFAAMNLTLQGVRPELGKVTTVPWESAERNPQQYDFVLSNPPFNMSDSSGQERGGGSWLYGSPPRGNDNFAWLQYALSRLTPGGRAAVVMPNKAGNSANAAERAIRKAMVGAGAVECIVALPPNLFSKTQVPVSVWLLRSPVGPPRGEILFVDASRCGVRRGVRRSLEETDREAISGAVSAWRAGQTPGTDPGSPAAGTSALYTAAVSVKDVGALDFSLNPIDYTADQRQGNRTPFDADALRSSLRALQEIRDRVDAADGAADRWTLRAVEAEPRDRAPRPTQPLGEICEIKAGPSYTRLRADRRSENGTVRVVFPRHLHNGWITDDQTDRVPDEVAWVLRDFRLASGDILLVRSGAISAPALVRDHDAGALFSTNLLRVRLRPEAEVDAGFLAYYLSSQQVLDWVRDRAASTAVPSLRADSLGQLPVSLPEIATQELLATALDDLRHQVAAHQRLTEELSVRQALLTSALLDGTIHLP